MEPTGRIITRLVGADIPQPASLEISDRPVHPLRFQADRKPMRRCDIDRRMRAIKFALGGRFRTVRLW